MGVIESDPIIWDTIIKLYTALQNEFLIQRICHSYLSLFCTRQDTDTVPQSQGTFLVYEYDLDGFSSFWKDNAVSVW